MSEQQYEYDLAVSFLSADEPLAVTIHSRLSEQMKVFVYSKRQEELGGTDGLVSLREAFYSQSRLVIVLYRDGWGKTRWTGVEERAIKEKLLDKGADWLLFVTLDESAPPAWVPQFKIRFNFQHFGLEELLGAIKLRVQELGAVVKVESAIERGVRLDAESQLRKERIRLLNEQGRAAGLNELAVLLKSLSQTLDELKTRLTDVKVEYGLRGNEGVLRTDRVSVNLYPPLGFGVSESHLLIQEWNGPLILPQEEGRKRYIQHPVCVRRREFYFDYQSAYGWCWHEKKKQGRYLRSPELADLCVRILLDLHEAAERGKVKPPRDPW